MQTFHTDLLCIGAGLAGERVAIEAAAGFGVICLSLVPARRSHSSAAQGGMQAALGNCAMGEGDCPDVHFEDTVKGSDWGCDQEVARLFVDNAPIAMRQLAAWGVPWNRVVPGKSTYFKGGKLFEKEEKQENEGLITARAFGGTAKWRTCYTSDGTGHTVLYTMDNRAVQLGVDVHDKIEVLSLIHDGGNCLGVVARCLKTGDLRVYLARATLIATGGFGRIYRESTNAVINDGGGLIIALDTGLVPLGNMEAVQFHPTGIVPTDILVTEGCRGDGGTLLDKNMYRFMPDYEPEKAELASRDVVSRWMTHHMRQGNGVPSAYGEHLWLDIRHLGKEHLATKLREVDEICKNFLGIDPLDSLIPVRPTQHYSMGGVRTNKDGAAYGLKGLFSAGEAACWDMHGFNRLGGNSLAETVVAGTWFRNMAKRVESWIHTDKEFDPTALEERMDNALAEQIYELERCIECGCCVAACGTAILRPDFLGAAGLNRIARFLLDPRDQRTRKEYFDVVGNDQGVFGCMGLLACEDVCPKHLPLQDQLGMLRWKMGWAGLMNILPWKTK